MYSIAICDSDRESARSLHNLCAEILSDCAAFRLSLYSSAEQLCRAISEKEEIDLLFLDIKLDDRNGIQLAKELRERGFNSSIVLMSSDSSYLLEGYTVQPIYFLLKPIAAENLKCAISADSEYRKRSETVTVKCGQRTVSLTVESIVYIKVMDHVLTIHTLLKDCEVGMTMNQLLNLLPEDRFCRCHKSYAVHLSKVKSLSRIGGAALEGEITVPVGRKYYAGLQRRLAEYNE